MARKGGDHLTREVAIRALRLSGLPVLDVAAVLDVAPSWVVEVCAGLRVLGVAGPRPPISEARRAEAERMLREGATIAAVCSRLKMGNTAVSSFAKALSLSPRRNASRLPPEKKARALAMLRAGAAQLEVARTVGMSSRTVWQIAKEAGVQRRRGPQTPVAPPKADRLPLLRQRAEARR